MTGGVNTTIMCESTDDPEHDHIHLPEFHPSVYTYALHKRQDEYNFVKNNNNNNNEVTSVSLGARRKETLARAGDR